MKSSRYNVFLALLTALLLAALGLRQGYCQEPSNAGLPTLPFAAAVEVSRQVYDAVKESRPIPDLFVIDLENGIEGEFSAARALGLVAFAAERLLEGNTSELPLPPDNIRAPVSLHDEETTRDDPVTVSLTSLLSEGGAILDFAAALETYPSAIWVEGNRLSAAEFMQGVASTFKFIADYNQMPEQVRIVPCAGASSWELSPQAVPLMEVPDREPASNTSASEDESPAPLLALYPEPGAVLSGEVTISAALLPPLPDAVISFFLDNKLVYVSNRKPYVLELDTGKLTEGEHKISARADKLDGTFIMEAAAKFNFVSDDKTDVQFPEATE